MTQQSSIAEQLEDWPIFVFCGAWSGTGCFTVLIILAAFLYYDRGRVATKPRQVGPAERSEVRNDRFSGLEQAP